MIKVLGSSSHGNCYIIQAGKDKLILDAGIPMIDILKGLEFNTSNVAGCLLTHCHKDHSKSIGNVKGYGIKIYTTLEIARQVNVWNDIKFRELLPMVWHQIGNFKVMCFELQHTNSDNTPCPCVGYLIIHKELGSLVYITDTEYCQYRFDDIDHILIECNYCEDVIDNEEFRERTLKSHMSLETCKKTLESWDTTKTKDITLIHLSDNNSDEQKFKEEIEDLTLCNVYIGKKGLIIE